MPRVRHHESAKTLDQKNPSTFSSVIAILILFCAIEVNAHDTFLKFESHHLQPKSRALVQLINGTFEKSENSVALERMQDVRITGPNQYLQQPENGKWRLTDELNELRFKTGSSGTYVIGVSIKPRTLEMNAEDFNSYLKHDGVLDTLKARKARQQSGHSDRAVKEKYSKHVKALFQVGEQPTGDFDQVLGYPIEIVPQQNPFSLTVGDNLPVQVLRSGKPVRNQLVYASYAGFHQHDEEGNHVEAVQTRTDQQGVAEIKLGQKGIWYVRLIHMTPSQEVGVDYESNWATLTFEVK